MGAWDQTRATAAQELADDNASVADEILFVDLPLVHTPGYHYILENLSLIGIARTRDVLDPPFSGLFLIASGQGAPPPITWNPASRGILIPLSSCYCCSVPAAGGAFAVAYASQPGFKITVPRDFIVRGIMQSQDGGVTPGPGALSSVIIRALAVKEPDCPVG